MNPIMRCCTWLCCWVEEEEPRGRAEKPNYGSIVPPNPASADLYTYIQTTDTTTPPPDSPTERCSVVRMPPANSSGMVDVDLT